jgi:hypothetical protein
MTTDTNGLTSRLEAVRDHLGDCMMAASAKAVDEAIASLRAMSTESASRQDAIAMICAETGCTSNTAAALWDRLRATDKDSLTAAAQEPVCYDYGFKTDHGIVYHAEPTWNGKRFDVKRALYDRQQPSEAVHVKVHLTCMTESNGVKTWGVCLARSPDASAFDALQVYADSIKGRAEYEADRLRHFFGQGPEPDILSYDTATPVRSPLATVQEPVVLHRGELPGREGQWLDERGVYYRLAAQEPESEIVLRARMRLKANMAWNAYQTARVSIDHTAKEAFVDTMLEWFVHISETTESKEREPQSAEATAAGLKFCCGRDEQSNSEIAKLRNVVNSILHGAHPKEAWNGIMGDDKFSDAPAYAVGKWASVPREIDREHHRRVLEVWNACMADHESLEMTWPKLVKAITECSNG